MLLLVGAAGSAMHCCPLSVVPHHAEVIAPPCPIPPGGMRFFCNVMLSIHPIIRPSVRPSVHLSVRPPIHPSVRPPSMPCRVSRRCGGGGGRGGGGRGGTPRDQEREEEEGEGGQAAGELGHFTVVRAASTREGAPAWLH